MIKLNTKPGSVDESWLLCVSTTIVKRMNAAAIKETVHVWHDTAPGQRITLCGTSTTRPGVTAVPRRLWLQSKDHPGTTEQCAVCTLILDKMDEHARPYAFAE